MRLAIALLASAAIATGAQAVTVINGSFEQGAPITGGSDFLPTGDPSITGWRVLSSGVDYVDSSLWDAAQGSRSVELAGIGSGGVQQRLTNQFIVGEQYKMTFSLSVNPFAADGEYRTNVSTSGNGAEIFTYTKTAANSPTNMLYGTYTYFFTATNVSQNIQFRSLGASSLGSVLDNVSISLVPEPANWMLLIAGFGMTGFAMRRRRLTSVTA